MGRRYDKPDSGFAWIILAANFVLHLLAGSFFAPLGIFVVEYLERFEQSTAYTAGIGATLLATWGLSGAFIGPLVQRFGFRRMVQVGTTLVVTGLGCSALAPSVSILYLTHGFIAGLGFSCWTVSMLCISQLFFVRRRAFSVAVCMAGLSFGVLFWSNFAHFAIAKYGYRGALVLMAGVNLHGYVIAAIFRAPNFSKQSERWTEVESDTYEKHLDVSHEHNSPKVVNSSQSIQTKADCSDEADTRLPRTSEIIQTVSWRNCTMHSTLPTVYQCSGVLRQENWCTPEALDANEDDMKDIIQQKLRFMPPCRVRVNIANENVYEFRDICKQVSSILGSIFDVSLLKIPTFSLFCLAIFLGQSGNFIPFNFIPVRMRIIGISKEIAARLITYMGLGSAVGRPLVGWIADQPWADRKLMYAVAHTVAGCSSSVSYFTDDYNALITYCAVFALASACYVSLQAAIICDLVGVSKLAKGIGLSLAFYGAVQMLATSLSGHLIDVTGNVAIPFLVFGLVQACGGLVGLIVYIMGRRQKTPPNFNTEA